MSRASFASIGMARPVPAAELRDLRMTFPGPPPVHVIDGIIPEPPGGAHRDPARAIEAAGDAIEAALGELEGLDPQALRKARREKFLAIGRTL